MTLGGSLPCAAIFQHDGDALADADAHGAEGVASAGPGKLMGGGGDETRPAHAQGMAEGNGAALGIEAGIVVGQTQLAGAGQDLRGEGFVQLDEGHVAKGKSEPLQQFARGRHRANAHDGGRHAGDGRSQQARARGQSITG